jgi:hypothetical protein
MVASRGRVCLNGFVRPDGELVTLEALADLLEQHGASPERVAVIRAAVTAGLAAVAVSLAACSIEPNRHGGDTRPVAAPADSNSAPRTGGIVAPTPAAELKPPPSHAGGISWEEALWLSHLGETDPH